MNKNVSLFLYLAIAIALLAYIFLVDADYLSSHQQGQLAGRVFERIDDRDIKTIRLQRGPETVVLERRGPMEWEMMEPIQVPAAAHIIQQVLAELAYAQQLRAEPVTETGEQKADKLKSLGLNPAAVRAELIDGDTSYVLDLGHALPSGELLFARTGGDEASVIVVRDKLLKFAALSLNDLRSRNIFGRPAAEIASATLRRAGEGIDGGAEEAIAQNEAGLWELRKPLIYPVNKQAVKDWLSKLSKFRVLDFISDQPENLNVYGLDTPRGQIIVRYQDGEEVTLLLGNEAELTAAQKEFGLNEPVYYGKLLGSSTVFLLSQEVADEQLASLQALRDRQVLRFRAENLVGLKITRGDRSLLLEKDGPNWMVKGMYRGKQVASYPGDGFEVYDLVSALHNLDAFEFVKDTATDLAPLGLDQPQATVVLESKPEEGTAQTLTLLLGKEEGDNVYAMVKGEPHVFAVRKAILSYLPTRALELRNKELWQRQAAEVQEVKVSPKGEPDLILTRAADGLFTSNQEGKTVDAPAAESLFSLLAQLRVSSWLEKTRPEDRLSQPDLSYTLTLQDGKKLQLQIGAEQPDGGFAAEAVLPDKTKEYFVLSAEDRRQLEREVFLSEVSPVAQ